MTAEVVYMITKPKELVSNIGAHKLHMMYDPFATPENRWRWVLKVVHRFELKGTGDSPAACRVEAVRYAEYYT